MLSVVIPTYNRKDLLLKCLTGLLHQTASKSSYEIIVVDDGSTDKTELAVNAFMASSDVAIKYIKHEKNKGPAAARNSGTMISQGDVVLYTGDDTVAAPNLLEEHLKWHQKRPGKEIAILGHTAWARDIKVTPFMEYLETGPQFAYQSIADPYNAQYYYFYTTNISLKKDFLNAHGYFDENFKLAMWEDTELGYRLSKRGLKIIYNKDAVVYHHHATNINNFLIRQYNAGRYAVLFMSKHQELGNFLSPHLLNPLLLLSDDQFRTLVEQLNNTDKDICTNKLSSDIKSLLFLLYELLCRASRDRGFLDEFGSPELVQDENFFHGLRESAEVLNRFPITLPEILLFVLKEHDAQIRQKVKDNDDQINSMLNSWSWKLTAPLRGFRKFAEHIAAKSLFKLKRDYKRVD